MSQYQLLALDLDGTVLGHDLSIDERVSDAIHRARAQGVHVTIATGRMFGAALPFARRLEVDVPLICYQGAVLRHPLTGEFYAHHSMPPDAAAEAITAVLDANIFVIAYIDERLYIAERRPELDLYLTFHPEGADVVLAPDLPALVADSITTKILFVAEPDVVTHTLARLVPRFAERLELIRSHQLFGEFTALGVSKGQMLEQLAQKIGVPQEAVIAIGDQENDLSMISWAGLGLAMGNAIPPVKAIADAVLPSVQEAGVAYAIEHYLL